MKKKQQNIINTLAPVCLLLFVGLFWQGASHLRLIDPFVLPPPISVARAFLSDIDLLIYHSIYTITNALVGLVIAIFTGSLVAILMDRFYLFSRAFYPILVLSQTVPYIAIAPLLILWFGHGMAPKIILVSLLCFFPIAVGLYDALHNLKKEYLYELEVTGGSYIKGLFYIKLPLSCHGFFSGTKIAVTYCFVGSVIAEWMGGTQGIGVYMTRVRRTFEFDKMFAVIFLVVIISILAVGILKIIERKVLENVS